MKWTLCARNAVYTLKNLPQSAQSAWVSFRNFYALTCRVLRCAAFISTICVAYISSYSCCSVMYHCIGRAACCPKPKHIMQNQTQTKPNLMLSMAYLKSINSAVNFGYNIHMESQCGTLSAWVEQGTFIHVPCAAIDKIKSQILWRNKRRIFTRVSLSLNRHCLIYFLLIFHQGSGILHSGWKQGVRNTFQDNKIVKKLCKAYSTKYF